MARVLATADLHGTLPDIPDCDLLLVGGDVCPEGVGKVEKYGLPDNGASIQLDWLDKEFRGWLRRLNERDIRVVGIAGNHDFVFERMAVAAQELLLPWTYLRDQTIEVDGISIHGTPWVPGLPRWAFYGSPQYLERRAAVVPTNVDILLSHGPPYGTADFVAPQFGSQHVGDPALGEHLRRIKPKALVCGHIHEQYGVHDHKYTTVYNVSHNTEFYKPVNEPIEVPLDALRAEREAEPLGALCESGEQGTRIPALF